MWSNSLLGCSGAAATASAASAAVAAAAACSMSCVFVPPKYLNLGSPLSFMDDIAESFFFCSPYLYFA